MKTPKARASIDARTLIDLGRHFERDVNFLIDSNGPNRLVRGPEIALLAKLDRLVRLILETNLAPFRVRDTTRRTPVTAHDALGQNQLMLRPRHAKIAAPNSFSQATQELAGILKGLRATSTIFDPSNQEANQLLHAPHIQLFLEVFFCYQLAANIGGDIASPIDSVGGITADAYNDFAAQVRQAMSARKSLRREWHNWNLGSEENTEELDDYLDRQIAKHGSVTAMHLRLFHAAERANLITAPVDKQLNDLQVLRACRARFFDRLRRNSALFTDKPGYVWAILPSLQGGYALHLTLLFNTKALHRVLDDKRVEAAQCGTVLQDHADQVGEYWVKVATGGQGCYQRGDAEAILYGPDWVHGEVRADDVEGAEKLKRTLGHFAMRRALIRLKNEPPGQYFGLRERKTRSSRRSATGGARANQTR